MAQSTKGIAYDKNSVSNKSQEEVVYTPLGPAIKSNVHYIDNKHYLNVKDGNVQVIQKESGKISREYNTILNKGIKNKADFSQVQNNKGDN